MIVELQELTLRALAERSFDFYDSFPATAFAGEEAKTYASLKGEVERAAGLLLSLGIEKGDRVAILGDNCPHWVSAYLAVTSMGAVATPILTGFTGKQIGNILSQSECNAAFISAKQWKKLQGHRPPSLRGLLSLEDFSLVGEDGKLIDEEILPMALESLPRPSPGDLAALIHTSGTTGYSKAVMLTHENIASNVVNSIERFPIDHNDRFLSILPLAHTFEATGGMLSPIAAGSSIYYMRGLPTPAKLLHAMGSVKPTAVLAVPLLIEKIYKKQIMPQIRKSLLTQWLHRFPLTRPLIHKKAGAKLLESLGGNLRFFMFGGAPLSHDVEVFLGEAQIQYATGYGLSETSPILTISPFGKVKFGSVGLPIPGVEIQVDHPDPQTGVGELLVRGPNIMVGYFEDPASTAAAFTGEGWLKTGDLGFKDDEGYLFLKGRSKNVIVRSSGENIYPESIEEQLLKDPRITQALVHEKDGRLVAQVFLEEEVLKKGDEAAGAFDGTQDVKAYLEDLRQRVNLELPAFSKLTTMIHRTEPFEMTPTNKIKRYLYVKDA